MAEEFIIISNSEENTYKIAQIISPLFHAGDVILLDGDLGAGKTCFVKGFADGLNTIDDVNSPTFSIANFYRARSQTEILHIDLYRITANDDFNDLGLVDYFDQSIVLIEWGKKFVTLFETYLIVSFQIKDDNMRILSFIYQGDKYKTRMCAVKKILKGDTVC